MLKRFVVSKIVFCNEKNNRYAEKNIGYVAIYLPKTPPCHAVFIQNALTYHIVDKQGQYIVADLY